MNRMQGSAPLWVLRGLVKLPARRTSSTLCTEAGLADTPTAARAKVTMLARNFIFLLLQADRLDEVLLYFPGRPRPREPDTPRDLNFFRQLLLHGPRVIESEPLSIGLMELHELSMGAVPC